MIIPMRKRMQDLGIFIESIPRRRPFLICSALAFQFVAFSLIAGAFVVIGLGFIARLINELASSIEELLMARFAALIEGPMLRWQSSFDQDPVAERIALSVAKDLRNRL